MRFMRVWLTSACVACALAVGAADASAAAQKKPKNASAQCADGTYSMARSQQGACSSHGGVKTWYGVSESKKEAKTEAKADRAQDRAARKIERTEQKADRKIAREEYKVSPRRVGSPADATARCNDGTYSFAAQHRGACSNHGGVEAWYK